MTRIALMFGGPAGEHEVSCASAARMASNLDPVRHPVELIRIGTDGTWSPGVLDPDARPYTPQDLIDATPATGGQRDRLDAIAVLLAADLAIPALHGSLGEDGTLQGFLETLGVAYLGNGVTASAVGVDKDLTKRVVSSDGVPVVPWAVVTADAPLRQVDRERLGLPAFVKPARAGSSVGVTRVTTWSELDDAVQAAREWDDKVLVEPAIEGLEVEVGLLEHPDGRLEVGPALRIEHTSTAGFLDYDAKYRDASTQLIIPSGLAPEVVSEIEDLATRTFRLIGCRDLVRVDFLVRDGREPLLNEINTMPGFTPSSQYPAIWAAADRPMHVLLEALIDTATARTEGERVLP